MIDEEEKHDETIRGKSKEHLDDQGKSSHSTISSFILLLFGIVFRKEYRRVNGWDLFSLRIHALLVKRWHVARRQLSLLFGFFFLPILIEILCVSVVPTPKEIQSTLLQNPRVSDAQVKLIPSIYDPQTIVTYFNENVTNIRSNLLNLVSSPQTTIDEISAPNVTDYVRARYYQSASIFVNKYQIGFGSLYNNSSVQLNAHFSTVNYHTMPTSLSVATNTLFQFYSNSTTRGIQTTNQPILTSNKGSYIAEVLSVLYCFEVFPVSLFSFLNSILVTIFIGILLLSLIAERLNHSKDLQLLTNLSRFTYWFSNWIFDFTLCLILCAILTIIVKVNHSSTIGKRSRGESNGLDWCSSSSEERLRGSNLPKWRSDGLFLCAVYPLHVGLITICIRILVSSSNIHHWFNQFLYHQCHCQCHRCRSQFIHHLSAEQLTTGGYQSNLLGSDKFPLASGWFTSISEFETWSV